MTATLELTGYDRLMSQVDTSAGPDTCHPWTGATRKGYGSVYLGGKQYQSHRWLLGYLRSNPLDTNERALHHCDNPPCCNPGHLYVGTQRQNMVDMADRGRNPVVEALKARTHCPKNHEYTPENTIRRNGSQRSCRQCQREANRKAATRRRAALKPTYTRI